MAVSILKTHAAFHILRPTNHLRQRHQISTRCERKQKLLFPGGSPGRAIETPDPRDTILDEIPIPEPDIVDMPCSRNDAFLALSILRKRSPPLRPSERRQCFSVNNSI